MCIRDRLGTIEQPTVLPDWLGELKNLQRISLPFCHLKKLPMILEELPVLQFVEIPRVISEYDDVKAWGIRYYEGKTSIGLGLSWFKKYLPHVTITSKEEEVEEFEIVNE